MKILLIHGAEDGEVLLVTPLLRSLKAGVKDAEIHFLGSEQAPLYLQEHTGISKFFSLNGSTTILSTLQEENYEQVIDLDVDQRSKQFTKALKKPLIRFHKKKFRHSLYTWTKLNTLPKKNLAIQYIDAASSLGIRYDGGGLDFRIDPHSRIQQSDLPASHQLGYLALLIGGSKYTRRLHLEKWKAFCGSIDHPLILIGNREDRERGEAIAAIDSIKIYNACGKFNLAETADLIERSRFVIANHTGLTQVAAALRKDQILIWGSTTEGQGSGPFYSEDFLAKNDDVYEAVSTDQWCRPCTMEGKDACPLGHFKCMKKISVEELLQKSGLRLRKPPKPLVWVH